MRNKKLESKTLSNRRIIKDKDKRCTRLGYVQFSTTDADFTKIVREKKNTKSLQPSRMIPLLFQEKGPQITLTSALSREQTAHCRHRQYITQ